MAKYRVTRAALYSVGSIGFTDPSARQGHYIDGNSVGSVLVEMNKRYPEDAGRFTVQYWDGLNKGAVIFDDRSLVV